MKTAVRLLLACFFLLPLLWTLATALKSEADLNVYPAPLLPTRLHWGNFAAAQEIVPMLRYTWNTAWIGLLCALGHLLSCPLAAYALARRPGPWTRFIWSLTLAAYVVPYPVVMLGHYALFQKLDWINTYWPLILPSFLGNPFFILYLTDVFRRFPRELEEAAQMEGASDVTVLFRVVLPLSKPALAAMAVFTLQGAWNDFLAPLLYLQDQSLYTVNLGLQFYRSAYQVSWTLMMAASLISIAPVVLLFFAAQTAFIGDARKGSGK